MPKSWALRPVWGVEQQNPSLLQGLDELDPAAVDLLARQAEKSWREPSVQIGDAGLLQLRTTAVSQVIIPSTLAGFLHFNCSWPHTPSHEGCSQTINHTSISIQSNIHLN